MCIERECCQGNVEILHQLFIQRYLCILKQELTQLTLGTFMTELYDKLVKLALKTSNYAKV